LLYVKYVLKSHTESAYLQVLTAYVHNRKAYQTTTFGENWRHYSNGFIHISFLLQLARMQKKNDTCWSVPKEWPQPPNRHSGVRFACNGVKLWRVGFDYRWVSPLWHLCSADCSK